MKFSITRYFRVPRKIAPAALDEHHAIKSISRWLLLSIAMIVLASAVMLLGSLHVTSTLDRDIRASERERAANALDLLTAGGKPFTLVDLELVKRIAGLEGVHLSATLPLRDDQQALPLLGQPDAAASYLVWTANDFAGALFARIAPVRVPVMLVMLGVLLAMIWRVRGMVRDIERQRRLAHRQSRTDVVTGLANRRAFDIAIDDLTAAGTRFGIIIFDLDHFKAVNDLFGHAAGDVVLHAIGQRLTGLLQPGDLLARLGGDEFVMLVVSRPNAVAMAPLAAACIGLIEQPVEAMGRLVQVGASLGIVAGVNGGLLPSTVLGAADAALYRAKGAGRGRAVAAATASDAVAS